MLSDSEKVRQEILQRGLNPQDPLTWQLRDEIAETVGVRSGTVGSTYYRMRRDVCVHCQDAPILPRHPYAGLYLLLDLLPADGCWTVERRAKWLATLEAWVDLLIEVVD